MKLGEKTLRSLTVLIVISFYINNFMCVSVIAHNNSDPKGILNSLEIDEDRNYNLLKENQLPVFEKLDRENGLINLSVTAVVQDKYGFIWIGTEGGLHRYDGKDIEVYRHDPFIEGSIPHNHINSMLYDDEEHAIWVGTESGLACFDINSETFKNFNDVSHDVGSGVIVSVTEDNDGNIWCGTMGGLFKIEKSTGVYTSYDVPGMMIRSMYYSLKSGLFVGTTEGVLIYNKGKDEFEIANINLPSNNVRTIDEFDEGILTIGLWDEGVYQYNTEYGTGDIIKLKDNRIQSVYKTRDDTLWIGTWGSGLFSYQHGVIQNYSGLTGANQLSHPVVNTLFQDESDILWIATNGGGLNFINPYENNYLLYSNTSLGEISIDEGKVNDLFFDKEKQLWISIYNEGINIIQNDQTVLKLKNIKNDPTTIPSNTVRVIKDFNDRYLLGTDSGIGYMNMETLNYEPWKYFQNMIIMDIEVISNEEIWIGTSQNGVYYYDISNNTIINYRQGAKGNASLSDNQVFDILSDSSDRVWIATNNGLNMKAKNSQGFKIYTKDISKGNELAGNNIKVIYEDNKENIWIGINNGGVARYIDEMDGFAAYTERNGISSNSVVSILQGSEDDLWVATSNGITVIDTVYDEIKTLSYSDGIGGYEFSEGAVAKGKYLYFSGKHGVVAIPKNYEERDYYMPKLYIDDVRLFDKSIENSSHIYNDMNIGFKHFENFISFSFIAVDYDQKEDNNYYYMLEGYDTGFINNSKGNTVSYSQLPPGEYVFKVYAKTSRRANTETVKFYFTVSKPFYVTGYAYLGYALLLLLLAYLILKLKENVIVNKKNKELAIVNGKLEEANESLKKLSLTDGLTNAFNRRYFSLHITEMIDLANRTNNTYISLLMIDIDNFKHINDEYGHTVGDKLLQLISKSIDEQLPRNTDILARYGGDEFAVILYDTRINGALIVAQKVRRAIQASTVIKETPIGIDNQVVGTTASIGVVSLLADRKTKELDIIGKADEALYRAKEAGKNRIIIAEGEDVRNLS